MSKKRFLFMFVFCFLCGASYLYLKNDKNISDEAILSGIKRLVGIELPVEIELPVTTAKTDILSSAIPDSVQGLSPDSVQGLSPDSVQGLSIDKTNPKINPYGKSLKEIWKNPIGKKIIYPTGRFLLPLLEENKDRMPEFQQQAQLIITELSECLGADDICGQLGADNEDELFFDKNNTPLHHVLEQSLDSLGQSIEYDQLRTELNLKSLSKLLSLDDSSIQGKTMLLLFNQDHGSVVRNHKSKLSGQARGVYLRLAYKYFSQDQFDQDLVDSITLNDNLTNIEVMNSIAQLRLSASSSRKLIKKGCEVNRNPAASSAAIIFEEKLKKWSRGQNIRYESICN